MDANSVRLKIQDLSILSEQAKESVLAMVQKQILLKEYALVSLEDNPHLQSGMQHLLSSHGYSCKPLDLNSSQYQRLLCKYTRNPLYVTLPSKTRFHRWRFPMKSATVLLKQIAEKGSLLPGDISSYEQTIAEQLPITGQVNLTFDKGGLLYDKEHQKNIARHFKKKGFVVEISRLMSRQVSVRLPKNLWERFLTWF